MYKIGDTCYFLTSNIYVVEGVIRSCAGGKYVVWYGSGKGIRLPESRLYKTREEAEAQRSPQKIAERRHKTPYDYM